MEPEGTTVSGGTTYYVSVSREHNGRVKLSCSAHYTSPPDEDPGESFHKLTRAVGTSLTIGAAAQASIETILHDVAHDAQFIQDFIALINEQAGAVAQRLEGN